MVHVKGVLVVFERVVVVKCLLDHLPKVFSIEVLRLQLNVSVVSEFKIIDAQTSLLISWLTSTSLFAFTTAISTLMVFLVELTFFFFFISYFIILLVVLFLQLAG